METNPRYHIEGGDQEISDYMISESAVSEIDKMSEELGMTKDMVVVRAIDCSSNIYEKAVVGYSVALGSETVPLVPGEEPWRGKIQESGLTKVFINLSPEQKNKISAGAARLGYGNGQMLDYYIHLLAHLEALSLEQENPMGVFLTKKGELSIPISIPENYSKTLDKIHAFINEGNKKSS